LAVLPSNGGSDSSNKDDNTNEDKSKEDDGNDDAPIKIDCGKDQYACGDQCYSFFRFNNQLVQCRCNDNVIDKSKFTIPLQLQLDTIELVERVIVNGIELVFVQ
jgi:hypothetical protein